MLLFQIIWQYPPPLDFTASESRLRSSRRKTLRSQKFTTEPLHNVFRGCQHFSVMCVICPQLWVPLLNITTWNSVTWSLLPLNVHTWPTAWDGSKPPHIWLFSLCRLVRATSLWSRCGKQNCSMPTAYSFGIQAFVKLAQFWVCHQWHSYLLLKEPAS